MRKRMKEGTFTQILLLTAEIALSSKKLSHQLAKLKIHRWNLRQFHVSMIRYFLWVKILRILFFQEALTKRRFFSKSLLLRVLKPTVFLLPFPLRGPACCVPCFSIFFPLVLRLCYRVVTLYVFLKIIKNLFKREKIFSTSIHELRLKIF